MPRLPSVLCDLRRTRVHGGAPGLHHRAAVRLGAVGGSHLPHLALHAVLGGGERKRRSPLPRTGFGGQLRDAFSVVVVGLRHRGVGLVRAGRAHTFVLVIDTRRGVEQLLEPMRTEQWTGSPQPVDVEDATGNVDVPIGGDFLFDQRHREQGSEVVRAGRLERSGMQRRRRRLGQIGDDVVPLGGHFIFAQQDFVWNALGHVETVRHVTGDTARPAAAPLA
jgi:hypothetical protein